MSRPRHTIAAFAALLLACGGVIARAAEAPKAPVVHRWGELAKLEPIDVDGLRVRLAFDAETAPVGARVMFYCLVDDFTPRPDFDQDAKPTQLGPFHIRLDRLDPAGRVMHKAEDLRRVAEALHRQEVEVPPQIERASVLYATSVVLEHEGQYRLTIGGADGTPVANYTLRAGPERVPAWMPWRVDWQRARAEPNGNNGSKTFVRNAPDGIARPIWSGVRPLVWRGTVGKTEVKRTGDGSLPSLERPDPAMKMSYADSVLTVKSEGGPMDCRADLNFLVRWWVNDKPVKVEQSRAVVRNSTGAIPSHKEYPFHLTFDPAIYGAKSGDRVTLQMMYCGGGWDYAIDDAQQIHALGAVDPAGPAAVRVTNRVEFVVP